MNYKFFALVFLLLLAMSQDRKTYRIPNPVILGFVVLGFGISLYESGLQGVARALQAAVLPVLLLFPLFVLRMLGAGDIKLFSAIGALMGVGFVFGVMLAAFLCGGVLALLLMAARRNGAQRMRYFWGYIKNCFLTGSFPPYTDFAGKPEGVVFRFSYAIALGTMSYSFYSFLL